MRRAPRHPSGWCFAVRRPENGLEGKNEQNWLDPGVKRSSTAMKIKAHGIDHRGRGHRRRCTGERPPGGAADHGPGHAAGGLAAGAGAGAGGCRLPRDPPRQPRHRPVAALRPPGPAQPGVDHDQAPAGLPASARPTRLADMARMRWACSTRWASSQGACGGREHGRHDRPAHGHCRAAAPAEPDQHHEQQRCARPARGHTEGALEAAAQPAGQRRTRTSWRITCNLYKTIGSPAYPIPEARVAPSHRGRRSRSFHPVGTMRQMVAIVADTTPRRRLAASAPTLVLHGRPIRWCRSPVARHRAAHPRRRTGGHRGHGP
jgi:hypothetical protein